MRKEYVFTNYLTLQKKSFLVSEIETGTGNAETSKYSTEANSIECDFERTD